MAEVSQIPPKIIDIAIGYKYPIDTISHLNSNSNLNFNSNTKEKPFFDNKPMRYKKADKKWYVVYGQDNWREFVGNWAEVKWK